MTKVFGEHYGQADSNCYDLGCSLGASTIALRRGLEKQQIKNCRIIAVDNSEAMIESCKAMIDSDVSSIPVDVVLSDIWDVELKNASVTVMNFTLQFIDPERRAEMIQRIYDALVPGGVLLLSEKIVFEEETENNFQIDMHHHFKSLAGYSDLEISQKRKALENVMIPDIIETHYKRLAEAGFEKTHLWFRCFNFVSMAAFKGK
jgi:tRNA (cmo5U34)-methyltransferase